MVKIASNKTKIDLEKNYIFYKLNFKQNTLKMTIIYEAVLVLFLIWVIVSKNWILTIILGVLIVLLVGMDLIIYYRGKKKLAKNYQEKIKSLEYDIDFYQSEFDIAMNYNGNITKAKINNDFVHRIFITKDDYYLYVTNNTCYILSKDGFNEGFDEEEFLSHFSKAKKKILK